MVSNRIQSRRVDEILRDLCAFPHRGSTTENERAAAGWIENRFREMGLAVAREPFFSPTTWSWNYLILLSVQMAAAILILIAIHGRAGSMVLSCTAMILSLASLYFFVVEHTAAHAGVEVLLPKRGSQNIVAQLANTRADKRVYVVAHYDTSRTGLSFHPRLVKSFRSSFLLGFGAEVGVFILSLCVFLASASGADFSPGLKRIFSIFLTMGTVYLLLGCVLMLDREWRGKYTKGANDNASGVTVMLRLAQHFTQNRCRHLELNFVATGCEESGMVGMKEFFRRHRRELEGNCFFLNLDNLGKGRLHFVFGEGMIRKFRYEPTLIDAAKFLTTQEKFRDVGSCFYSRAYYDALIPARRRLPVVTLSAFDDEMQLPHWHWHTDTIENVDVGVMEQAEEFSTALIQFLDTGASQRLNQNP